MAYTERPGSDEYAPFYSDYIARVPRGDLVAMLRAQVDDTCAPLEGVQPDRADFAYAPGKWTLREVVGHLSDAERVLSYRALRVARGDATPLAGFDENDFVAAAEFGERALEDLLQEFRAARRASVTLFAGLAPAAWTRRGMANDHSVSVRALACILAGHELHHRAILRERYGVGAPPP